jgi:hypothetical protein
MVVSVLNTHKLLSCLYDNFHVAFTLYSVVEGSLGQFKEYRRVWGAMPKYSGILHCAFMKFGFLNGPRNNPSWVPKIGCAY